MSSGAPLGRAAARLRGLAYDAYHRLARLNYERELLPRRTATPAGPVRTYEPWTRHGGSEMLAALCDRCGPADVVYDVGANVGVYALALATGAPDRHVVAFEPSPPALDRLRANRRLNDPAGRIDVRPHGLGDATGERPFYVSTYPQLSAFDRESARRWEADVAAVVEVPVRRLDDVAGPPPDVCKVDVEGAAPAVLRGGRETLARHRPALFVEVHDEGLSGDVPGETRAVLDDLDYAVSERDGYWRCEPR